MSAICGIFRFDGRPVSRAEIRTMIDAIPEFGPDGVNCWAPESPDAPVALAHLALRITPEDEHDTQPKCDADAGVTLVADARIDNRQEIAERLRLGAQDVSDADLVLAAYRAWGDDCVRHLVGDYAFALWDRKRRALVCARDAIGQRALFLHRAPGFIAVATSVRALLALPGVPRRLSEERVADFVVLVQDLEHTLYEGIERLRPAHVLVADAQGVRQRPSWTPDLRAQLRLSSSAEYVEAFREVFDSAVRDRLRGTGDLGMLLSAGLDSSTVAVHAAPRLAEQGRRLIAWHNTALALVDCPPRAGWAPDESAQVRQIIESHPTIELNVTHTPGCSPFEDVERYFRIASAPVKNVTNWLWMDRAFASARQLGLRVMLTGQKGNATISYSGIFLLRQLVRRFHWLRFVREAHALAVARGHSTIEVIKDMAVRPLIPRRLQQWRQRNRVIDPLWKRFPVNPELARRLDLEHRIRSMRQDPEERYRQTGAQLRAWMMFEKPYVTDTYDAVRGLHGIETRDPTADRRVVEFCLAVPEEQYLHMGRDRLLIRRAMAGRIPEDIIWNPLRGSQVPDWSRVLRAIRPALAEELARLRQLDSARHFLDLDKLERQMREWPDTFTHEHYEPYHLALVRGIMVGRFLRWVYETGG
jgi:asparagine synthase (glutamine-hydrolysing)